MNEMKYKLEKAIWTQEDFSAMGWHDCPIYAIQLADDILLDIDYILEWVSDERTNHYSFWIAPATLQFIAPYDLEIAVKLDFVDGLEITEIEQEPLGEGLYEYKIVTQEGDIQFKSKGYRQHIRQEPILQESQCLEADQRGGYPLTSEGSSNQRFEATS